MRKGCSREGHRGAAGSAVLYTIVLSPLIVLSLALVVEVGSLQLVKQRLSSAADMATVDAAGVASDASASGHLDAVEAVVATRQALYDNLQPLADQMVGADALAVADSADVYVVTSTPSADPLQPGHVLTVPTVEARIRVPVHSGLLAASGLPNAITMNITSSAALREAGAT